MIDRTDRTDRRDKHLAPALIKARPHAMGPGIEEFDKNRFEALLQGASRMTEAIQEERPLARSPLIRGFDAPPAHEGQAGLQDEAGISTAGPLADTSEPPSHQDHSTGAPESVPGSPQHEAQDPEQGGILAGQETLATPASLDPRILNVRRKRKLQIETKMHEDAARTMAQEQAAARPAQQLPPSGPVAGGKAPPALRVDGIGAVGKVGMAPRTTSISPSPELPDKDALVLAPEQEEGTRQHRQQRSERQETVAAEVVAAQVVQEQILAQRNMPESLPLHLLESI